jgi:hypothetical protein
MRPSVFLRYLLLPLRTASLMVIVIFGVLLTFAEHAGIFGIPMLVIIGSWFFKYGFALMDDVVDGRPEPPVLSSEMVNPLEQRPLGTFFILIVFYFVTAALRGWVGGTVVLVLRLLLLSVVPAMVAAMSVTGRFVDALNPVAVFGIIVRIPAAYAKLLLGIGALWIIPTWLASAPGHSLATGWDLESLLPGAGLAGNGLLAGMLGQMLFMYLWIATFVCIGGTLYECRDELGIEAAESPQRKAARANAELERRRDKMWDRVYAEVRGGALANARETVRKMIAEAQEPIEACRWLYVRATAAADQRLANYLAQLTLARLLDARATGQALDMVRERLAVAPNFRPLTSAQVLRLAQLARDAGDRSTARRLLADFNQHYANDPMAPVAAQLQNDLD